jgi:hypothetical protein
LKEYGLFSSELSDESVLPFLSKTKRIDRHRAIYSAKMPVMVVSMTTDEAGNKIEGKSKWLTLVQKAGADRMGRSGGE